MARTKKAKAPLQEAIENPVQLAEHLVDLENVIPNTIDKLSVDYPSEGLNNMARKINEIIDRLNG